MNGRVYDPVIGRFLSRDPLVDGRVSQGANGYAYVWNNPMTLTDPTGFAVSADDFQRHWETGFSASWLFWPWMTHHHDTPIADKYRRVRNPPPAPPAEPAPAVREAASTTPMHAPIGVPLARNDGRPWHGMTAEELAELRADAYLHGADALEFLGYTLIALDVANTMTGVLAGPDVGLAGIPLVGLATSLRVNAARGGTTVIGKLDGLKNLHAGEHTMLSRLPNRGSPQANWYQNSGILRQEMGRGLPIRDASVDSAGNLINNTGFLRAERNLLQSRGWTYNPSTTMWHPPVGP
jgi:hypothetical protein